MFRCSQGRLLRVSHESRGKNHGLAMFFLANMQRWMWSQSASKDFLCVAFSTVNVCKCKCGSVSNVYSDSPLTSKMIVPWHMFHMLKKGGRESRRWPRRPPSIFVPAVHLNDGVGQLVALTYKSVWDWFSHGRWPTVRKFVLWSQKRWTQDHSLMMVNLWVNLWVKTKHKTDLLSSNIPTILFWFCQVLMDHQHPALKKSPLGTTEIMLVLILDEDVHVDARQNPLRWIIIFSYGYVWKWGIFPMK